MTNYGTTTLKGSSSISDNDANFGAGAYNWGGSATLALADSSSIHHNNAVLGGGGVFLQSGSTLALADSSSIHHNTALGSGGVGGYGTLVDVECGPAGNVHDNSPDDCNVS
jgi:hypothetical protein